MKSISTAAIIALAAMTASLAPAAAQVPKVLDYPKPDDRSVKATVYNMAWYMGMLRGNDEVDGVMTLEHQASGVIQVAGKPCTLSAYRQSINYFRNGARIQYVCKTADGQTRTAIEVMSGKYAWDEDVVGAEMVPGVGKATPKPALYAERAIRLWASPQGAPKAAAAGGDKTTVAWVNNRAVVTYPIPGVPDAIATATLDKNYLAEKVVVRQGKTMTEFTYGDYKDWNNPLNLIDAVYAGQMTEKKNGVVVRDLKTVVTETGNLYVIMPVPKSVSGGA